MGCRAGRSRCCFALPCQAVFLPDPLSLSIYSFTLQRLMFIWMSLFPFTEPAAKKKNPSNCRRLLSLRHSALWRWRMPCIRCPGAPIRCCDGSIQPFQPLPGLRLGPGPTSPSRFYWLLRVALLPVEQTRPVIAGHPPTISCPLSLLVPNPNTTPARSTPT